MSITVIDVAKEAGVSRTTVSNVFNNRAKYSQETYDAVLVAAKKLGYKPNLAAKSLITHKSRLIGLILPSYVDPNTLTSSPFYNIIIDGIYSVLREEAYYDLIIFCVPHREKLNQVSDWIDTRNVDGILAMGEFDHGFLKDLDSKSIPILLIDNYTHTESINFSYINSDDEKGGYLATQKLISAGYEKIAMCCVDLYSPLMQRRYKGYKKAISEAQLEEFVFENTEAPFETGMQMGETLIEQGLDAAFCTEDMLAVGLLHFMQKKGIEVGKKFGIIGFDNINIGRQVYPELSTIDQGIFEKGETAAKTLLRILKNETIRRDHIIMPVKLITRDSTR
jgi:LacI family transcriptional regulator